MKKSDIYIHIRFGWIARSFFVLAIQREKSTSVFSYGRRIEKKKTMASMQDTTMIFFFSRLVIK